jgi:hypothetical protein
LKLFAGQLAEGGEGGWRYGVEYCAKTEGIQEEKRGILAFQANFSMHLLCFKFFSNVIVHKPSLFFAIMIK